MSLTLGLQTGHESSAVLMDGTRLVAAVSDERITRVKNEGGVLRDEAIDSVLAIGGTNRAAIDRLALLYTFFPEEYVRRETTLKNIERKLVRAKRSVQGRDRPQLLLGNFIERLEALGKSFDDHFDGEAFRTGEGFDRAGHAFFDHHLSHAWPAAYYSGFAECAVITMDGTGDRNISHTSGVWRHGEYQREALTDAPGASPGLFYSHITQILGFKPMRHEGKIVGLAAFGDAEVLRAAFSKALRVSEDGLRFDSDFVGDDAEGQRYRYLEELAAKHSREDASAAVQQVLEDACLTLVRGYLQRTGLRRLALNGGVFANVKLNQRIAALDEVDEIFVFPAMSDTGNSIGAALLDIHSHSPQLVAEPQALEHMYLGPEYSDAQILAALNAVGLASQAQRLDEATLVARAADAIHAGRIVGWFQGRMEFGPRALGNRSMLARPIENEINNWLNDRLDRSEFMPFAPSVLAEHADNIFEGVAKSRHTAEFMTITYDVKPEWRKRIAAVVHVDGTARPQLVRADRNALYHKLISAYHARSGIPLVLNTSFNVHEEPIVCAPPEAIRAFTEKRVDCLGIGPFWLEHS